MKGQCFFSFLGGAALGAVVAVVVGAVSGQNTRHTIVDTIKHGEQKVKDAVEEELYAHKQQ